MATPKALFVGQVTPIFVVGMNRSGTKWLSNILCNHPDIAGVRYDRGGGIQETNMFSVMPQKFGDLTEISNYIGLIELWARTDFFRLTGIDKAFFYRSESRGTSYTDLFRRLMDEVARRNGARYWLQKIPPEEGILVLGEFPGARVVIIQRGVVATVRSSIQQNVKYGRRPRSLVGEGFQYAFGSKCLERVRAGREAYQVTYERLREDVEQVVRDLCEWLEIPFHAEMVRSDFRQNTSFSRPGERETVLKPWQEHVVQLICAFFSGLPLAGFHLLRRLRGRGSRSFLPGTFGMVRDEHQLR
jgi:hypothetical protein